MSRNLKGVVLVLTCLLCTACGNRIDECSHAKQLSMQWQKHNYLQVTNVSEEDVQDIRISATFYQEEVLPHTIGYAQYATPAGWYSASRTIKGLAKGEQVTVCFTYNIGPGSR